eukprot:890164_1
MDHHTGHTAPEALADGSHLSTIGFHGHFLVAAALGASNIASHGTVHGHKLLVGSINFDRHIKLVTSTAEDTHAAVGFLQGFGEFFILSVGGVEPLEFVGCFAAKDFLETSFAGLSDAHTLDFGAKVLLEPIGHFVGQHLDICMFWKEVERLV